MTRMRGLAALTAVAAVFVQDARAEELTGTLRKIKERGEIVIGHRESSVPFSYFDEKQEARGFSVELCSRITDTVKRALNAPEIKVRYVPVTGQTRIPLLTNGTIDIECGATTNTLTRQQQVDFSHIMFVTGTRLLVRRDSNINEIEDIGNRRVVLVQGTTNEHQLQQLTNERRIGGVTTVSARDHAEAMLLIESGRADVYFTDDVILYTMLGKSRRRSEFHVVGRYLTYDPYGYMVRRDDSAFRLVVNRTLSELFRSGEIDAIYKRWFEPLGIPLGEQTAAAYRLQALPN